MKGIRHDVMAWRRGVWGGEEGGNPGRATVDVEGTDFGDFWDMDNGGLGRQGSHGWHQRLGGHNEMEWDAIYQREGKGRTGSGVESSRGDREFSLDIGNLSF